MSNSNLHKNHRKRMQERAEKNGLEGFSDHELLEMLLFYARPRVDTNPIAHELINTFGSVKGVLDAGTDDLCRVEGVGPAAANLIKLIPELLRRYELCALRKTVCYNEMEKIAAFMHPCFIGLDTERLYLALFNSRMNLLDCVLISEGSVNATDSSLRKISELILNKRATCVVLAHNHPQGVAFPSEADLCTTSTIQEFLRPLNVSILEHFIFNDHRYYPIMFHHFKALRPTRASGLYSADFYDRFYRDLKKEGEIQPLFAKDAEKCKENE